MEANPSSPSSFINESAGIYLDNIEKTSEEIRVALNKAERPVLLIGDGIHQSGTGNYLMNLIEKLKIPVLSSRFAQDIAAGSKYYFGFIGSHATRYSNFVLSKCDLVIALGNRLAYDPSSESFGNFTRHCKVMRVDIDSAEFSRNLSNVLNYHVDIKQLLPFLTNALQDSKTYNGWIDTCITLKNKLFLCDTDYPVETISRIIKQSNSTMVITSDVGKNELWLARAYALAGGTNRVLYSKSLGASGSSLPKAIGAYYTTNNRVICFTGDVGFQMNIQELQLIAHENLPITIVLLNNFSSGMIRDEQEYKFNSHFVHSTPDSGYSAPDFHAIARAYSIPFNSFSEGDILPMAACLFPEKGPNIIELKINEKTNVLPKLPKGRSCQDFDPRLDQEIYEYLNNL
jgi:acetolactate synthase-1/2/3 large subunit